MHDAATVHKIDYLFRSRIKCAHCDLRMWGSRRGGTHYYLCQPAHQRGEVPPDHPRTVYVNEHALLCGVTDFLEAGIYGPDRVAYWEQVLAAADPRDDPAPLRARISGEEGRTAELRARLRRQVLNLEAEDLPPQTRQRVVGRIAELEEELARAEGSLVRLRGQAAAAPPTRPRCVSCSRPSRSEVRICATYAKTIFVTYSLALTSWSGTTISTTRHK